ncbi:MAG: ATP-binding protein [Bacteroidia bacterium]|nr:ATP-binding protein [Bacteroidia bacterium]
MGFCKNFILTSSEGQIDDKINVFPFLFSTETENNPSSFEIVFFINNTRYRYGFEADQQKIHSEWLFSNQHSTKETRLFFRELQDIKRNTKSFKEGAGLETKTRPNALFLSIVAQFNGEIATQIITWFKNQVNVISTLHPKFDESGQEMPPTTLDFHFESRGTEKLLSLLGPWFDTLENGKLLIVDELDSRLHTLLTYKLLEIFHSKINTKNAQLIFASHDTNLLRKDLFRRDQIWFTEKNHFGS